MRLDINYKKKSLRNTNTWRLNNTFLNNQQVIEEIKREIKKYLETNNNENTMVCNKSNSKRDVYRYTILPQETRKTSNRQPNFTPRTTGGKKNNNKKKLAEGKKS